MRNKLLAMLMGVMLSAMMTTAAFAEFVYVTKHGKKYHHAESRFVQNKDAEKITLEEAQERGLEPSQDYLKHKESLEGAKPKADQSAKK